MTTMQVRHCPRCELRFTTSSELEQHLRDDHPAPAADLGGEPALVAAPTPESAPVRPRSRVPDRLFAAAGVLLIVNAFVFESITVAVATTVLVLAVAALWIRRARARNRAAQPAADPRSRDAGPNAVSTRPVTRKPRRS